MAGSILERDWKYMKKVKDDLLVILCQQINRRSVVILNEDRGSEYEKYLRHYEHVKNSDHIIAECFNDRRRSTLMLKLIALQHYDLLTEEQVEQLSGDTQQKLKALKELQK